MSSYGRNQKGFTLVEGLIIATIIAILTAVAIPLLNNARKGDRFEKAHADANMLVSAVVEFGAREKKLPKNLEELIETKRKDSSAYYLDAVPMPPPGWQPYTYVREGAVFRIFTAGDGKKIIKP